MTIFVKYSLGECKIKILTENSCINDKKYRFYLHKLKKINF